MRYIDLRSDTVTNATQSMRDAMYIAEIGDDVYGDDPTVIALERLAAEKLGKEAALFVPSGTMGNQIAIMTHTERGDEIICSDNCHIFSAEVGGAAMMSGCSIRALAYAEDLPDVNKIEKAIREDNIHYPHTGLICLENALACGSVVPVSVMDEIYKLAQNRGIPVHLDGARVFNAAISLGVDVKEITSRADSVMACLSKGLCAPVGSVLAGEEAFIKKARKNRKAFGGGMRQAGFLAAAGIVALNQMIDRLADDHENARYLACELTKLSDVSLVAKSVDINMAFIHFDRSAELMRKFPQLMLEKGIKIGMRAPNIARFVTNNDVTRKDLDYVIKTIAGIIG